MSALLPTASADWLNLSGAETAPNIAEVTVYADRVEVALEIYIGDIEAFDELVPDDWFGDHQPPRPPLAKRLAHFARQGLAITTDQGQRLPVELRTVEARLRKDRFSPFAGMVNPYSRQRTPEAPVDKRVLYVELVYPFAGTTPSTLTLTPPLDQDGRARAVIGFIVFHRSVPVIDFRYLSAASTLTLDDDPWYSVFDNPNLKRHHKDALMSFLYVEPYEVRHEVLTRVKDLAQWMDLGLRGDEYIELDELEALKQRIGEFFLGKNPVTIDGQAARPILDRTRYVKIGVSGLQILEQPQRLEIDSAIVGVIISYITDGIPQQVEVNWELFTDNIQRVPATATDPAGPLATYLDPDDRVHRWTNYLKNYQLPTVQPAAVRDTLGEVSLPLLSLACAVGLLLVLGWMLLRWRRGGGLVLPTGLTVLLLVGVVLAWPLARVNIARPALAVGELGPQQAAALLETLLKNSYRAFDYREESDVYDKLALSVSGELLTDIYLQHRRSLAIRQGGGAQAKVKEVIVEQARAERVDAGEDSLAYALHGTWTALGSVGHWGHVHQRKNRYQAVITVAARDGRWTITGLDLQDEQRIDGAVAVLAEKDAQTSTSSNGVN